MVWSRKGPPKEGASEIRCYLSGTKEEAEAQGEGGSYFLRLHTSGWDLAHSRTILWIYRGKTEWVGCYRME